MIHKFEDYQGRTHEFKNRNISNLFEEVDKLEEGVRDKYFDDDEEFTEGIRLAKKLKGQLRRIDADVLKLNEIKETGIGIDEVEE